MTPKMNRRPLMIVSALMVVELGLCVASVYAGETSQAVTISLSGSTAMRNFTTNANFTALRPGGSVTLANGFTYTAAANNSTTFPAVQLGANTNDDLPPASSLTSANYRAFRTEWHEQGSIEGILEMANDQIGTLSSVTLSNRNPTVGNPVWINGNIGGRLTDVGTSAGGYEIKTSTYNTYTNFNLAGSNTQGGQNRVQMAISDVTAAQGFSISGGTAAWNRTPGQMGYGKGNSALALVSSTNIVGLGNGGVRRALNDQNVLNMSTDKIDPSTGTNYTAGAWNDGGLNNLTNKTVAITATTFSANPGTGLTKLNRTDAQFLQTTGRLANGADFNVVTRDVNSGTLNVAALNAGLDPSFVVGENDNGDGNASDGTTSQVSIGAGIKFSGKTAGGGELRPTIQNSRMALGHLSIGDAGGTNGANGGSRPIRVLAYRDDANDVADGSNGVGFADATSNAFVKPTFDSVSDGSYVLYQNETYVTVKQTGANYNADAIKGDYATNDVRQFRDNILNSAGAYPNNGGSLLNPANGMVATGFIPTKYMQVRKDQDGLNQSVANPTFVGLASSDYTTVRGQALSAFTVADASAITSGGTYGNVSAANGGITIDANNFLFGDFDYDGDRDFADIKLATVAQDKLAATAAGVSYAMTPGSTNIQVVIGLTGNLATKPGYDGTAGAKRGDLIVKGDFDSNGTFDGKDLYLLARGASLADSTSTDTLNSASGATFGDQVRRGVLRKNAALDFMNTNATAQQKIDARANGTNDPTGVNAFNKFDINRDGKINRQDAAIVDKFVGNNITDLGQQIAATVGIDGSISSLIAQRSISLVDVELQDNLSITATLAAGTSDFKLIRDALSASLIEGDATFDGAVNFDDLVPLAQNYNLNVDRWSKGDFNLDGLVNFDDLVPLAQNYNTSAPGGLGSVNDARFSADWALAQSLVPEPTVLTFFAAGAALAKRRRRSV